MTLHLILSIYVPNLNKKATKPKNTQKQKKRKFDLGLKGQGEKVTMT